ncbi:MAG TPA: Rieske 2Fe-2S domain-containing protein, partial [Steroidobacteraceae bacterium]|nr:Rieske 2Fe-2S domain-containing protein [Steroidobacteraceae bacterium]
MAANPEKNVALRQTGSKLDLIRATVAAISEHGLSELTSAKIASAAGHTAASINFHFGSKEALLLATLREVSEEFASSMARVTEEAGDDPLRALLGIVDASLGRGLSDSHKIAVWYAFLSESKARGDYQRICGERDSAWSRMVIDLCKGLIAARGSASPWPDAGAVAQGLMGLIDQEWQGILFEGDDFDREAARRQCRAYLCSVFPWLAPRIEAVATARPRQTPEPEAAVDPAIKLTLPAWAYHSEEFHELEREQVFLSSWQVVCHQSELPEPGDYVAFEFFGRRGFVVRGTDGEICAFHNVCAHRAHAVVSGDRGHCAKFLTCMYHGWTYHLDGRNRSVSAPDTFPKFDRSKYGLKPIELETFMGMVFVRFRGGEPSVAERMAPHVAELSHYRIAEMVPLDETWTHEVAIDWKNVVENYVEDYHFPIGHPGLSALMEAQYDRENFPGGTMRLSHRM